MGENGKKWRADARKTIGHDETKAKLIVVIKDEQLGKRGKTKGEVKEKTGQK